MEEYFPDVIQAIPGEGRNIYCYFSNGAIRKYDVGPLIDRGGVFEVLRDEDTFRNKLTVMNNTVAWDIAGSFDRAKCIDLDPFTLYDGEAVRDPLEETA